ncbi:ferritin-like domain-containing protein [Aurantimonas sp. C2-6-R+9]|uniref:YciE/YciF ferroxidase family protein n=1 Tax=unclassified Aurantimonas TaxID=2638230 RepID=UPI002E18A568|nr:MULTISPECIES: ferritin-like domain-containing protein [unclassified Aurantimonas]MEC5292075.1 ferritin-like domain-containing protein [Aurantimonas sp. C2-3-R2]MEC5323120.1 ferritin-like domain-containing protein [Aurantimonas sp. A3-2-R12]MEC5382243.1 ferritin-like domain-containing protein [Aurantimonas sp. C2-6-R+9]MEC5413161.1 ferritin-like domain-containing protein [Aurantimonas sp. C2-4-R8]
MALANLKDIYLDQLQDVHSADTQAAKVTRELAGAAHNDGLKKALQAGVDGIEKGLETLKAVIAAHDAKPGEEFCKGMEGLVKEARAHGIQEDISDPDARDAMIISQYQRMAHYAIAGYGCLVAFAKRLDLKDDAHKLQKCLDATYHGDAHMTKLAEGGINKAALG